MLILLFLIKIICATVAIVNKAFFPFSALFWAGALKVLRIGKNSDFLNLRGLIFWNWRAKFNQVLF